MNRNSPDFLRIQKERMDSIGECELCGSKRMLELHHIIPLVFDGDESEENLILLCRVCHVKLTPHSLLTKRGLQIAKSNGKQIGATKGMKLTTKKSVVAKEQIKKYSKDFCGDLDDVECIGLIGVSRNSYYKYKRELKEGQ